MLQRFRDELGDWRVCLLTPFGARVHAPWALAIEARLRERLGVEVQPIWSDDGIVVRLPATDVSEAHASGTGVRPPERLPRTDRRARGLDGQRGAAAAEAAVLIAADEVEELVVGIRRWLGALRQPLPRERGAGAAAAATPAGQAHAAVADAPAGRRSCWPVASRYGSLPDHPRDVPRVPPGRLRPAGAAATSWRPSSGARSASSASRRRAPRRSRARCSSTTSPPTCTRATRRWPTAARRRWRSTATCCASCWAPSELRELLDAGRAGRAGAGAAGADARTGRRLRRPGPRPAAPPGRPGHGGGRGPGRGAGRGGARAAPRASGWRPSTPTAGPSGCGSPATSAGSRPRTPAATGMRSASRRRSACRRRSWCRPWTRWRRCSSRWARRTDRSWPTRRRRAGACRAASSNRRWST